MTNKFWLSLLGIGVLMLVIAACGAGPNPTDTELQARLRQHNVYALSAPEPFPAAQVELGQALFFDPILSGNRDISCATCHHPAFATGDALPLSFGTGGVGLGPTREVGSGRLLVPRNAPEIFNRGHAEWRRIFWDSRVELLPNALYFTSPAEGDLPMGLENLMAAQAMFPVTSRDEMRGQVNDLDIFGDPNELAGIRDSNFPGMWAALMVRLMGVPEYREMFAAAYPDVPAEELGFQHAANALAAFEISAFTFLDSPFDRYVAGDLLAMTETQKLGAVLFYGEAGCAQCHAGPLFSDQEHHNIGVPQLGPGKEGRTSEPFDYGRWRETRALADKYAFRTPPLRNVAITGPWMHNGAYETLEDVIRHHLSPVTAYDNYDVARLPVLFQPMVQRDVSVRSSVLASLSPLIANPPNLTDFQIELLIAFLESLTSPSALDLNHLTPSSVPSGLPLDVVPLPSTAGSQP